MNQGLLGWPNGITRPQTATPVPFTANYRSGRWVGPQFVTGVAGATFTNGQLFFIPQWIGLGGTVDRIGISTEGGGSAGSVARLGIYADDGNGAPGDLVLDAGEAATTSSFANVAIAINVTLASNTLYWLAFAQQGNPTTRATIKRTDNTHTSVIRNIIGYASHDNASNAINTSVSWLQDPVTGPLPAKASGLTGGTQIPGIAMRWA